MARDAAKSCHIRHSMRVLQCAVSHVAQTILMCYCCCCVIHSPCLILYFEFSMRFCNLFSSQLELLFHSVRLRDIAFVNWHTSRRYFFFLSLSAFLADMLTGLGCCFLHLMQYGFLMAFGRQSCATRRVSEYCGRILDVDCIPIPFVCWCVLTPVAVCCHQRTKYARIMILIGV